MINAIHSYFQAFPDRRQGILVVGDLHRQALRKLLADWPENKVRYLK